MCTAGTEPGPAISLWPSKDVRPGLCRTQDDLHEAAALQDSTVQPQVTHTAKLSLSLRNMAVNQPLILVQIEVKEKSFA